MAANIVGIFLENCIWWDDDVKNNDVMNDNMDSEKKTFLQTEKSMENPTPGILFYVIPTFQRTKQNDYYDLLCTTMKPTQFLELYF